MNENKRKDIRSKGFFITQLNLPDEIRHSILKRDWILLDQLVSKEVQPTGQIFERLSIYERFSSIEFIISIRSSITAPDEDGIWHDDGSRILAFSLSLSLNHKAIKGGVLEIRKKGSSDEAETSRIFTPPYGSMIIFATGVFGFEHKINKVTQGERLIIAGWCT